MSLTIYKITNSLNGMGYVGATHLPPRDRFRIHCQKARRGYGPCTGLYAAMREFGVQNFTITELAQAPTRAELGRLEGEFIRLENTSYPNGYNIGAAGSGVGAVFGLRHGMCDHPLYRQWSAILQRCNNPNHRLYPGHGGIGIRVCRQWREAAGFLGWALSSGWQAGLVIERRSSKKGYSPSNCYWSTGRQRQNNRSDSVFIKFRGKSKTVPVWADEVGIETAVIRRRLQLGWSIKDALTIPTNGAIPKDRVVFVIDGQSKTQAEWSRETGVSVQLIRTRLRCGWSTKDAVMFPSHAMPPKHSVFLEFRGERKTLTQWSDELGSGSPSAISKRLQRGWDVGRALTMPMQKKRQLSKVSVAGTGNPACVYHAAISN